MLLLKEEVLLVDRLWTILTLLFYLEAILTGVCLTGNHRSIASDRGYEID